MELDIRCRHNRIQDSICLPGTTRSQKYSPKGADFEGESEDSEHNVDYVYYGALRRQPEMISGSEATTE